MYLLLIQDTRFVDMFSSCVHEHTHAHGGTNTTADIQRVGCHLAIDVHTLKKKPALLKTVMEDVVRKKPC